MDNNVHFCEHVYVSKVVQWIAEKNFLQKTLVFSLLNRKNCKCCLFFDEARNQASLVPQLQQGVGQDWLFSSEVTVIITAKLCSRTQWGPPVFFYRNWGGNADKILRQNFKIKIEILKWYFAWGLSQVNVPACTSPSPASHFSGWLQSWQTNKRPQVCTWC